MEFKIDKKALETVFALLMKVTDHSREKKMKAELAGGKLRLSATDMTNTLQIRVSCVSEDEGSFFLDAPRFWLMLKELPDGPVTITLNPPTLEMDWELGKCRFALENYEDFPPLPALNTDPEKPIHTMELDSSIISAIKASVAPATSDVIDDIRPIFNGLFFNVGDERVTVVGTDGQMLLTYTGTVTLPQDEKYSFLIPKATIDILSAICSSAKEQEKVTIQTDGKTFICSGDGYQLNSLCINQAYPAYQTIMAVTGNTLRIPREDLLETVRRTAALTSAQEEKDTVVFSITGGLSPTIKIEAQNVLDFATVQETFPCEWDGEDIRIGFKIRRLLKILKCTNAERVTLSISAANKPVIFAPENDDQIKGMIMPAPVKEFIEPPKRGKKK